MPVFSFSLKQVCHPERSEGSRAVFPGFLATLGMTIVAVGLLFSSPAHAACTGPTGVAGQLHFSDDYNMLTYCDNTNWLPMYLNDYQANAVTFDGTNDYLSSGAFTGVSNSKQWTGSFWFKKTASGTAGRIYDIDGTAGTRIEVDSSNRVVIFGGIGGGDYLHIRSSALTVTGWNHVMFSVDLADTAKRHLYVNGVSDLNVVLYVNNTMDFTDSHYIGARQDFTDKFNGDLADLWLDFGTYIDLSSATNRAKFIDGRSKPVHLGTTGERPTGIAPDVFLSGATASWETNDATGGGLTETGALTTATHGPSARRETTLTSGLIAHWRMNGGLGATTAIDSSGSGYTGTLTNMDAATDWVAGKLGGALDFDGSNDHILVTGLLGSPASISLTAWVRPGGAKNELISLGDNVFLRLEDPTVSGGYRRNSAWIVIDSPSSITNGVWTHLAYTYTAGAQRLYINGVQVATGNNAGAITYNQGSNTYIGKHGNGAGPFQFSGRLDDVRVYNRAITQTEVRQIMGCSGPVAPPGTMIYDSDRHVMTFCDGNDWLAMGSAGDGGAGCTSPSGVAGAIVYNTDHNVMQYCEGDTWVAIGKKCGTTLCGGQSTEKIVFLSPPIAPDDIGGISAGDAYCQARADASGLEGTYKIWLADSNASSAPATRFTRASVPYRLVNNTKVADDWADLTDGTLDAAINIQASGAAANTGNGVSTNVASDGTQKGTTNTCSDWTSGTGNAASGLRNSTTSTWTDNGTLSCSNTLKVYCFEQ